ncbi:MAG: ABC transporter permease [Eubacteriales bacterium]
MVQSAPIALMAVGMTYVIITAEIDLSVAAIQTFIACLVAILMVNMHVNVVLAILVVLLGAMICGSVSGFFVAKFKFPAFISSLGMSSVATGLALVITKGYSISGFSHAFNFIGQGNLGSIPVPILIIVVVYVVAHLVLSMTKFGLDLYAIGGNEEAARLSGINVGRIKFIALAISGFTSGLAGIVIASRMASAQALVGSQDMLDVIAAVVIGGTSLLGGVGTIIGTAIGVLILGTIRNGLNLLGVSPSWQMVTIGAIILCAVLVDYFGKKRS